MITVFKYVIDPYNPEIEIFIGAEILSVAFQREDFCIWAKVDTSQITEKRNFYFFGTGHEIKTDMGIDYKFIGTGYMDDGLVFHAFERLGL
jgi:hypothetical protein